VYPGATEEVRVPIVERTSGLRFNEGFGCGYSSEGINTGDTEHILTTITKVTSGSTPSGSPKSVSTASWQALTALALVGGKSKPPCPKSLLLQPISLTSMT